MSSNKVANTGDTSIYTTSPRRKEVTLPGKGTLILADSLIDEINYLHKKVGSIEWCGILFYEKVSGDINRPDSFVLKAHHIYPMNVGSETYTAAEITGEEVIDMYENIPNAEQLKQGLIHTHHAMKTFFSGTDMSELHDNVENHNFYLSLIVNFSGIYTAKVAYPAKMSVNKAMEFKNSNDELQILNSTVEEELMVMIDMDIIKPELQEVVPTYFQERYSFLQEQKAKRVSSYSSAYNYSGGGYGKKDHQDWETGYITQGTLFDKGASSAQNKAKTIQATQKTSGKLVNAEGLYISVTPEEMRELIVDWMNAGLDADIEMIPDGRFNTVFAALEFYDSHFKKNPSGLDTFLILMERSAKFIFRDYSPILVVNKIQSTLAGYMEGPNAYETATDLYNVADSLRTTLSLVEDGEDRI